MIVALFVLLSISTSCFAADWFTLSKRDVVDSMKIDVSSIDQQKQITSAWFLFNTVSECERAKKYDFWGCEKLSTKSKVNFNCLNRTFSITRNIKYSGINGTGSIVNDTGDTETEFQSVVPDSRSEVMFKFTCRYKNHSPKPSPQKKLKKDYM